MEKVVKLNRSVIPDFDNTEFRSKLRPFGIDIRFLFDDGIALVYDSDNLEPYIIGQDSVSFYDTKTRVLIIQYIENFGKIEFVVKDKVVAEIPIVEL